MSDVINLRQARKKKARADAEKLAAANRVKHGRTKAEKKAEEAERKKADQDHEGHKRERD